MLTTRVIFRLLDAAGRLIGWTEHPARVRGDGQLWSTSPVVLVPDVSGVPAILSTHWVDVHVETRVLWPGSSVLSGQPIALFDGGVPILKVGDPPGALPAVTVRLAVGIEVPVGDLAASPAVASLGL